MGRAHCLALAGAGADIVASDICRDVDAIDYHMSRNADLEETVARVRAFGRRAVAAVADITKEAEVRCLVERAMTEFGRIDILVNNAGIALIGIPTDEVTEKQWDRVLEVNLKGAWLCCKHVIPHMRRQQGGRIINISSHCGLIGIATLAPYNAAKHGVIGLTRTLAVELAPHRITVNAICPAAVATPMLEEAHRLAGVTVEQAQGEWGAQGLRQEVMPPEEISGIVAWLASDQARFINGRSLLVGNTTGLIP